MRDAGWICLFYTLFPMFLISHGEELAKDEVDKVIEDELTHRLAEDLLQSIERKFQIDLERSVDMVLVKIKLLLQNGTVHIQDQLAEIQGQLTSMKEENENEVDACLADRQNETTALAEKALHQMVVCGYALIGHDPAQAVKKVLTLKNMISTALKPLHDQKKEVYGLLKVCGHDHDSLKKVIKCVISKSPLLKSAMMDITGKLIDGVVSLTKLMAHGAMHEACLIEVIKTTEEEAFQFVKKVKDCVYGNSTFVPGEFDFHFTEENNTTASAVDNKREKEKPKSEKNVNDMLRRMLEENDDGLLDPSLQSKFAQLKKDLASTNDNVISNPVTTDDK